MMLHFVYYPKVRDVSFESQCPCCVVGHIFARCVLCVLECAVVTCIRLKGMERWLPAILNVCMLGVMSQQQISLDKLNSKHAHATRIVPVSVRSWQEI